MFLYDTLSLIFVALVLLGTVPNLFYSAEYLPHIERKSYYLIHYFAFIFSMIGVVISANALIFGFGVFKQGRSSSRTCLASLCPSGRTFHQSQLS